MFIQNVLAPDCHKFGDGENNSVDENFSNLSSDAPGWPPFSKSFYMQCIRVYAHTCLCTSCYWLQYVVVSTCVYSK